MRRASAVLVLCFVVFAPACNRRQFLLPGGLVLSRYGWDQVGYFDGLHYAQVRIVKNIETGFVSGAQVGPDSNTYAISYKGPEKEHAVGNAIVTVARDGSAKAVFRQENTGILDFAVTDTALVILAKQQDLGAEIEWVSYKGEVLSHLAAPSSAIGLIAATDKRVIVWSESDVLILREDHFEPINLGYSLAWINSYEVMYYTDSGRCTWKYNVDDDSRTKVYCNEWFAGAASPDGRYIVVKDLTTQNFHDIPELRVVDTKTGHYIPVIRGIPPEAYWIRWTKK